MSSFNNSGGLTEKLEASLFVDILTLGVLGYLAYFLYTEMSVWERSSIFTIPEDPHVLAFQLTILLIIIYTLEALHDKVKGSNSGLH